MRMEHVVGNCRINCAEVIDHSNLDRQTDAQTEELEEEEEEELKKNCTEKGDSNKSSSNKLFVDFFPSPLLHLLGARRAEAVPFCSSADFYGP